MEGISGIIKRNAAIPPNKRLHSEAHVLADEMVQYFSERKKFGMYLGVIKRLGVARTRAIFASIKDQAATVENPRKLFMWLTRKDST
jgi:hypothetical protein